MSSREQRQGKIGIVYAVVQMVSGENDVLDAANQGAAQVSIRNIDTGTFLYQEETYPIYSPGQSRLYIATEDAGPEEDLSGDTLKICVDVDTHPSGAKWILSFGTSIQTDHIHETETGIEEFDNQTPSNVDVIINGDTVAENVGTGDFATSVDVRGELEPGEVNEIELTSNALGHIQAWVEGDVYRQITGDG